MAFTHYNPEPSTAPVLVPASVPLVPKPNPIGPKASAVEKKKYVPAFGKGATGFTLPTKPSEPKNVEFYANNKKFMAPSIHVDGTYVSWLGSFLLDPAYDKVEIVYV